MALTKKTNRVLIIGTPGAGKSTFAVDYAKKHNLPLIHLDQEYFLPNWKKRFTHEEWEAHLETLIAQPQWVMDGNYSKTLARRLEIADHVIWLQVPMWKACVRVLKRELGHLLGLTPKGRAPQCKARISRTLLRSVFTYEKRSVSTIRHAMEQWPEKFEVLLR